MRNTKTDLKVDRLVSSTIDAEKEMLSETDPSKVQSTEKLYIDPRKERKLLFKFDVFPAA